MLNLRMFTQKLTGGHLSLSHWNKQKINGKNFRKKTDAHWIG